MNKMNKRADIAVTLLVIMTLALCGYTLFTFAQYDSSVEKSVVDFKSLGNFYDYSRNFEFYLFNLAKISTTNINTNSDFIKNFLANYSYYGEKQNFYPEYLSQIKNLSKYDITIAEGKLYFRLKDFEFNSDLSKIENLNVKSVTWKKDIIFEINLK